MTRKRPGSFGVKKKKTPAEKYGEITEFYTIGKCLGEGTFGKVRKGTHRLSGIKVAIKILMKKRIVDVADVERVAREIMILKKVKHVNIIRLFEVVDTPKYIFLIMEFASGGELFDHIVQCQRVQETDACRFIHMIVNGVDYCHKNNIIHRDLKPENLLFDRRQVLKICDFGLGNIVEPGQLLKTACGSPCYAAPEMIAGQKYNGSGVDVWSMGVILYALLCGYLPFEDSNTNALYRKIISGEYVVPGWVSRGAQDMLKMMLCTDPKKRYSISKIREHPWYKRVSVLTDPLPHEQGKMVKREPPVLNEGILKDMVKIGYDAEQVKQSVMEERHDHFYATYHLLELRKSLGASGGRFGALVLAKERMERNQSGSSEDVPTKEKTTTSAMESSSKSGTPRQREAWHAIQPERVGKKETLIMAGNKALHIGSDSYRVSPAAAFRKPAPTTRRKRPVHRERPSSGESHSSHRRSSQSPAKHAYTAAHYTARSATPRRHPASPVARTRPQGVPRLPVRMINRHAHYRGGAPPTVTGSRWTPRSARTATTDRRHGGARAAAPRSARTAATAKRRDVSRPGTARRRSTRRTSRTARTPVTGTTRSTYRYRSTRSYLSYNGTRLKPTSARGPSRTVAGAIQLTPRTARTARVPTSSKSRTVSTERKPVSARRGIKIRPGAAGFKVKGGLTIAPRPPSKPRPPGGTSSGRRPGSGKRSMRTRNIRNAHLVY